MVIRELRLNEGDEYADIELGPLHGGRATQYLDIAGPRRPPGDFPLVTTHRESDVDGWLSSARPTRGIRRERTVDCRRHRQLCAGAGRIGPLMRKWPMYTREDRGRIAMLLDNLIRHYTLLGLDEPAQKLATMKLEFLRGGLWGRRSQRDSSIGQPTRILINRRATPRNESLRTLN